MKTKSEATVSNTTALESVLSAVRREFGEGAARQMGSVPIASVPVLPTGSLAVALGISDTNMMPILCLIADRRYCATGYGVLNLFACLVGGATIYAGGVLRDAAVNVKRIFQFGAFCILACGLLLFFLKPKGTIPPAA